MRGDMDAVETSFLESVRRLTARISNIDMNGSASAKVWDYTMAKNAIENNEPYPSVFIEKVIGARKHELPLLEKQDIRLNATPMFPHPENIRLFYLAKAFRF